MSTSGSDADCSYGKEVECSEIIIDVKDVRPARRYSKCCIYKVPNKLREVKEEAYTPKLISIGPVHHNKEQDNKKKLEDMGSLKLRYFKEFFHRTCRGQKEFANIIEKREKSIRHCYAEEISLPGNEYFVKMILLDSIFIIELFLRTATREVYEKDDYVLCKPWLEEGIKRDLILLENQLPFFILDNLYRHIGRFPGIHSSFLELAWNYFFPDDNCKNIPKDKEVKHFTDLYRHFFHPPNLKIGDQCYIEQPLSATKLDTAGLIFQKRGANDYQKHEENKKRFLLDIQYNLYNKNSDKKNLKIFPCISCSRPTDCLKKFLKFKCLEIPEFVVEDGTEELFRNLMALEQFHNPYDAYICNYIMLLDFLINSEEDVELLVEKKIIVNLLGSNKVVVEMINKLCLEIVVETKSHYSDVAHSLNMYHSSYWNKSMAPLKNVYFRDIWRGTATLVGVVVLLITILNFLKSFVFKNI